MVYYNTFLLYNVFYRAEKEIRDIMTTQKEKDELQTKAWLDYHAKCAVIMADRDKQEKPIHDAYLKKVKPIEDAYKREQYNIDDEYHDKHEKLDKAYEKRLKEIDVMK